MKGITLPVNVLVLVAIAVIILLGLVGLYFTGFSPFSQVAGVEGIKNEACRDLLIAKRCLNATNTITITKFDANKNGVNNPGTNWNWVTGTGDDNLAALCYNYYGARNESQCKYVCTCVGMGISGGGTGPGPSRCTDGTPYGQCSNVEANKPSWCDNSGNLIPNQCGAAFHNCPCPASNPVCQADGSCISAPACSCNWQNEAVCGSMGCNIGPLTWGMRCVCAPAGCGLLEGITCAAPPANLPEGSAWCTTNVC